MTEPLPTAEELAEELRELAPVSIGFPAHHALHIISWIQLASRHPAIPEGTRAEMHRFVAFLTEELGPKTRRVIEEGWRDAQPDGGETEVPR